MKIAKIRIENILGIDHLEVAPGGTLTEISGPNGTGKTSVLEAIRAAVGSGHDATLLRQGAERGEVVIVLDDGVELRQRVTATATTRDLIKDGKKIPRPSDTIKSLTDLLSINPVEFLTAPKKDRVKVLLEAMPINVDPARLTEITRIPVQSDGAVHGLHLIEVVRQQVYEDRTGTNRAVKEKEGTINQLELAMPDVPGGVEGNEDELRTALEQARAARDAETQRIDAKLAILRQESNDRLTAIRAAAQAIIDAAKADADAKIQAEREALTDTEAKAGRVRQKAIEAFAATAVPIDATLAAIRTNRNAYAKREQTQATIAQMRKELESLVGDAAAQTEMITQIDAYKSELLDSLPIPGLEVKDGEVFRHGVAFDRLNTAQQVEIAIEIARLRAGDLPVCCIDRFECLSPEAFEAFKQRAEETGLQLFVTRVAGGEFNIATQ